MGIKKLYCKSVSDTKIHSIMRFKKGSKVEVMSENKMVISWKCAEIISSNDQTCLVKFESRKVNSVFERVSWKVIRPCPPPPSFEDVNLRFVAGETVEVFDYYGSWLSASILNVLNKDLYLVKLHESSEEMRIPKSRIRARLSWEEEKWVSVGDTCSLGSFNFVTSGNRKNEVRNDDSKKIGDKIPSLEKDAYRSILEALYVSGPLSWENEMMLTNLRIKLHISNDEHLVELRNLISSGKG